MMRSRPEGVRSVLHDVQQTLRHGHAEQNEPFWVGDVGEIHGERMSASNSLGKR
jgi:hypothetical protein